MSNVTKVSFLPDRRLPSALLDANEFRELTEYQRQAFNSRLRYIEEISVRIFEWPHSPESGGKEMLGGLELDVLINVGISEGHDNDRVISSWLIHHSWTIGISPGSLHRCLSEDLLNAFDISVPALTSNILVLQEWFIKQAEALRLLLTAFYEAKTFTQVMASYVAIDIVLAQLLAVCYRGRLNPKLS
jgi:hypothetical protein